MSDINAWIVETLTTELGAETVLVGGDGRHFEITIVSSHFEGHRPVKKQQMVSSHSNQKLFIPIIIVVKKD